MYLPGSIHNRVLVGHQGHLFLAGGSHNVLDIVTGKQPVPESSYAAFQQNIISRQAWAAENNATYLHIIFPDKQSIIPEAWTLGTPLRIGDLYIQHCRDLNLPIFYPNALLAASAETTTSKVDTHATNLGYILVTAAVVERLTGESQDKLRSRLLSTIDTEVTHSGDLGSKFDPHVTTIERISTAPAPGRWLHNKMLGGNNGMVDLRFNADRLYDKRIAVFGDSFGREISRFLQFWFREVLFFRTGFFHPELAEMCRPDFVITEMVERYLDKCFPDSERPSFFMYPHLSGVPYSPPAEFATAFSALLSVPRAPYQEFYKREFKSLPPSLEEHGSDIPAIFTAGRLPLTEAVKDGNALQIEQSRLIERKMPQFVLNLSGREITDWLQPMQAIHGSDLIRRHNVLLIGPNIQIQQDGSWSCESQAFRQQFLDLARTPSFQHMFPGPKPAILREGGTNFLDFDKAPGTTIAVKEPIFLATPAEPNNWGRWMSTVIPKLAHFRRYGKGHKLMCCVALPWQRRLMDRFGIFDDELIAHDPGRAYYCSEVMTVEHSVLSMSVSRDEQALFAKISADSIKRCDNRADSGLPKKVFVSRLSISARQPNYRVLQNEAELATSLNSLGFVTVEPEKLDFDEQVAIFAGADYIVCIGGAALYNSVFCKPDAKIITIESSETFLRPHCELLCSLPIGFGVIIGMQDLTDPTHVHKRWTVDVELVCRHVEEFV